MATGIIDGTDHIFKISGTEKLRIDSSGRLLIGTTTEGNSVADDLTIAGSGDSGITIRSGTSNEGSLMFSDATSGSAEYAGWVCYNHNSNFMRFFTNATERLRITGSGDVLIGATSSTTVSGAGTPFQVSGSDAYTGMSIIRTASAGAQFQFASGSNGDNVSNNDALGYFKFFGYHTNGYDEYARIHAEVDGTNGDGDAPGAIVFSTTNDGASSVTERMRLKSSTLTVNATLDVDSSSTHHIDTDINSWGWRFYQSNSSSPYGMEIKYDGTTRDDSLGEFINCLDTTAVRFKVTSDGDVWNHDNSYGGSDQTLKENIVDASSKLEDLKKLKVRNFNWKADHFPERSKRKMLGFIAQEVEEVFPSLIKEYNITGDNDNPIMKKAIKQAWAPILVKALQEAVAKIETLETKVAALESA